MYNCIILEFAPCEFTAASLRVRDAALQVGGGVGVGDPYDVLLDDGSFVEVLGHVVARCADQLHAAFLRLAVGTSADEGGKERVVDVDDRDCDVVDEVLGEDLHVPREDDEIDVAREELDDLGFGR